MDREELIQVLLIVWNTFSIEMKIGDKYFKSAGQNKCLKIVKDILEQESIIDINGLVRENLCLQN